MCREAGLIPAVSSDNNEVPEMILREGAGGKTVQAQLVYLPRQGTGPVTYYTHAEVATLAREPGSIWIIVHNAVYDLTSYATQHPGGRLVLQHFNGHDATDVLENYHRAHVFQHMLPRFYRGQLKDPSVSVPPHVQALRQVRQDLLANNKFVVPRSYYIKLHAWLASLFLVALYCTVIRIDSVAWQMTGAALLGLFWQQFAGLGHDVGHTAVTKSWSDDHWAGSSWGAAFTGLSTAWWKHNHNTHHVVPNAIEDDPNIQHLPLLAVSEQVIEAPYESTYHNMRPYWLSQAGAAVVSYQHYIFLPLMMVARFNLYALGLKYLFQSTNKQNTRYRQTEILCICGIFPVWYGWVAWHLPTRGTMAAWIFLSHAVTMLLHLQIVVSHWSMETYRSKPQEEQSGDDCTHKTKFAPAKPASPYIEDDWYLLQFRTTMDIACPAWLDWLHIGLQFQTVHHLYPTLPRPHLRAATARVKEVCAQHKIHFAEMAFVPMVADSLRVLRETAALARTGQYTRNHLGEALRAEG